MTCARRDLLVAAQAMMLLPAARGQRDARRHIAVLAATTSVAAKEPLRALRVALSELGHVEGASLRIDERFADGAFDRLPALAAELVRLEPEVLWPRRGPIE
jgi:putative ABC transport system substrate-binding protein